MLLAFRAHHCPEWFSRFGTQPKPEQWFLSAQAVSDSEPKTRTDKSEQHTSPLD
jgi:hypothetical protein